PIPTPTPPSYSLGEEEVFWISDQPNNRYFTTTAVLKYVTPHLYVWLEKGYRVDERALREAADRFDNEIYPRNRALFGSERSPGIDNDPRIHIFNGHVPGVGGYYSSADEYPRAVNPYSNEKEIFYINLDVVKPGSGFYESILAHEFQHMIHWNVDRNEDTWVNEGLSQLAEYINRLPGNGSKEAFAHNPDTQLTSWPDEPKDALPNYGASFLFMAYFLERFGEESLRKLVASPANGVTAFNEILAPMGLSFEDVFADWLIANYLDEPSLADGRYGYREIDPFPPAIERQYRHYPITRESTVHQYGADYIELRGQKPLTIRFSGSPTVTLAPVRPHSGQFMWWSNRGDEGDSTLTKAFDLRGVDKATLQVWMWYDIEEHYDYAYIEVSTDGGKTWQLLRGLYTTPRNPNGNNLGWGYTGISGKPELLQKDRAKWVREIVNLSPYAGQEVLLRFEYITDDAVSHPGLFIDDISIPEIGYYEDFESGYGGWEPHGFIYTDGVLPQKWIVQVIELGHPPRVRRMEIGPDCRGEMEVQLGAEVPKAVLVISAYAPATSELARYTYTITP
ncbi:MAG TPA: hypothetical protein ENG33_06735, partial [Chloroflexi bacterium]|nr:hypothetical protein [Chloroflexota bacterium]